LFGALAPVAGAVMPEPIVPLPMVPVASDDEPMGVPAALLSVGEGLLVGAGAAGDVAASSSFLPQAPSARTAARARAAAAADVTLDTYMSVSLKNGQWLYASQFQCNPAPPTAAWETCAFGCKVFSPGTGPPAAVFDAVAG